MARGCAASRSARAGANEKRTFVLNGLPADSILLSSVSSINGLKPTGLGLGLAARIVSDMAICIEVPEGRSTAKSLDEDVDAKKKNPERKEQLDPKCDLDAQEQDHGDRVTGESKATAGGSLYGDRWSPSRS